MLLGEGVAAHGGDPDAGMIRQQMNPLPTDPQEAGRRGLRLPISGQHRGGWPSEIVSPLTWAH
jgi:hypothetical protein